MTDKPETPAELLREGARDYATRAARLESDGTEAALNFADTYKAKAEVLREYADKIEARNVKQEYRPKREGSADDYVAWCRYTSTDGDQMGRIVTCDSDAPGAFKIYRAPELSRDPQPEPTISVGPCPVCEFHWGLIVMPGDEHSPDCPHHPKNIVLRPATPQPEVAPAKHICQDHLAEMCEVCIKWQVSLVPGYNQGLEAAARFLEAEAEDETRRGLEYNNVRAFGYERCAKAIRALVIPATPSEGISIESAETK